MCAQTRFLQKNFYDRTRDLIAPGDTRLVSRYDELS
jgi:hypothetical protein